MRKRNYLDICFEKIHNVTTKVQLRLAEIFFIHSTHVETIMMMRKRGLKEK